MGKSGLDSHRRPDDRARRTAQARRRGRRSVRRRLTARHASHDLSSQLQAAINLRPTAAKDADPQRVMLTPPCGGQHHPFPVAPTARGRNAGPTAPGIRGGLAIPRANLHPVSSPPLPLLRWAGRAAIPVSKVVRHVGPTAACRAFRADAKTFTSGRSFSEAGRHRLGARSRR